MDAEDGSAARARRFFMLFKVYETHTDKYKYCDGALFSDGTVVVQRFTKLATAVGRGDFATPTIAVFPTFENFLEAQGPLNFRPNVYFEDQTTSVVNCYHLRDRHHDDDESGKRALRAFSKLFRVYKPNEDDIMRSLMVGEGVLFRNGTVVIQCCTTPSLTIFGTIDDFYEAHTHPKYGALIKWEDGAVSSSYRRWMMKGWEHE